MNYPISPEARTTAAIFLWGERARGRALGHRSRANRARAYRMAAISILVEVPCVRRERVRDELIETADRYARFGERLRGSAPA